MTAEYEAFALSVLNVSWKLGQVEKQWPSYRAADILSFVFYNVWGFTSAAQTHISFHGNCLVFCDSLGC